MSDGSRTQDAARARRARHHAADHPAGRPRVRALRRTAGPSRRAAWATSSASTTATSTAILAMKVLSGELAEDASSRTRFLAEAKITASLQHPGIVAVHDPRRARRRPPLVHHARGARPHADRRHPRAARRHRRRRLAGRQDQPLPRGRLLPPHVRRGRLRAQPRRRPPRSQALQPDGRRVRRGAGHGLGPRQARRERGAGVGGGRRRHAHPGRRRGGHARLHAARAGSRRAPRARVAERRVVPRRRAADHPHPSPAGQRAEPGGAGRDHDGRGQADRRLGGSRSSAHPARAGRHLRAGHGLRFGRALRGRGRAGRGRRRVAGGRAPTRERVEDRDRGRRADAGD